MQAARGASLSSSDPQHRSRRPLVIFVLVALSAYLLDQVTKALAVARLEPGESVPFIGDLLKLTLVRNPGAAFSTGTSYTIVLSAIAVTAVVVVLFMARRLNSILWAVGLGCLLGGALGNLTDRLLREPAFGRGHVIDFFQLPHWPVFNVADMCINVAAAIIIIQAFRGVSHDGRSDASEDDDQAEDPAESPGESS